MKQSYSHAEAFCLMEYQCKACGNNEVIWNSRDGVTPFGVNCRHCQGEAFHVNWQADLCRPEWKLRPGDRFFRDGTVDEARAIMRQRLEKTKGTAYELPETEWPAMIEAVVTSQEFMPGWPTLDVWQKEPT